MSLIKSFKPCHITTLRTTIQALFTLFCLYFGWQFYQFYLWCLGERASFVPRPAAVEAFLPISGLVNLKQLIITGVYDPIHPASLTIFMAVLLIALLLRKGFCGWICPVGFTSNLVEKLAQRLGLLYRLPDWLSYPLLSLKYLLLGFFFYIIVIKMSMAAIEQFSKTPYNIASDAKMLLFFLQPTTTTLWVMGFLVLVSFFSRNFWCRFLCPYGALLGILALASPLRINRDAEKCIDCQKCTKICPASITVASKKNILSPDCIGCGECIGVCPKEDCLSLQIWGGTKIPFLILPLAMLLILFAFYGWAVFTGHWQSQVPLPVLKQYFQMAAELGHP